MFLSRLFLILAATNGVKRFASKGRDGVSVMLLMITLAINPTISTQLTPNVVYHKNDNRSM